MPYKPFPPPRNGWTCFHCGCTMHSVAEGMAHFGISAAAVPACILKGEHGLLIKLRAVETERNEMEVRLYAARLGCSKKDEDDAVARYRATSNVETP